MTIGVLVAMLFVAALFAGATVLPIMLLILLLAAGAWALTEWRARGDRQPEPPVNGSGVLSDAERSPLG